MKVFTLVKNEFYSAPAAQEDVSFVIGTSDINTDDTSMWNATYAGKVVWDEGFKLNSATTQQNIKDFCKELETLDVAT